MADGDAAGGLFTVAWGLWATGFGWIVATDFRGAARRFHALSEWSVPFGRTGTPRVGVGFVRFVAGVFALVGPVVLVGGLLELGRGHVRPEGFPRMPVSLAVFAALLAVLGLWMFWRPSGWLRREWDGGGGVRRAATVVITVAGTGFQAALVLGRPVATLALWLLGGAAGMLLLPTPAAAPGHGDAQIPR
ncbi:hypothetical protein [Actinacidiphila sp. bgisy160]|uniref:hypothetical protein n=1 Tax=Actinacidiphila sp. bgisy160 TaxID=3413796 RepID=UPI003D71E81B